MTKDPYAMEKLRVYCENARTILALEEETVIKVQDLYQNHGLQLTLTRKKFEELCFDLLQRCIPPLVNAMNDAEVTPNDLTEVVLTGGVSQTPILRRMLQEYFQGKAIRSPENHNDLSAFGAALEAGIVMDVIGNDYKSLLQLDATSQNLGVETEDGKMHSIINRNTTFPNVRSMFFTTTHDNQTDFTIKIYEGLSEYTRDNLYLGEFTLEGI